jgi:hypothetical protein
MYDTVVICSPYLEEYQINQIEKYCTRVEGKILETDEIQYAFTRSELSGSYDYRIRINVLDFEWVRKLNTPEKVSSKRYLRVECSVHKLMMGHNVYGGPERITQSISLTFSKILSNAFSLSNA